VPDQKTRPQKHSAREKLQLSKLNLTQQELMGEDIDLDGFYLQVKGATGLQAVDRIIDAKVSRTMEGASTIDVTVEDYERHLLNSPLLHNRCDVRIDGLWFRLAKLGRNSGNLTLTFEDREVAVLRTYSKPIKQSGATSRANGVTRAEFILRLLREVKEFKIPYIIPDLHKAQPIESTADTSSKTTKEQQRQYGISDGEDITIKGEPATPTQKKILNTILDVAMSQMAPNAVMMMAVMAAIQESTVHNNGPGKPGDFNYRGPNPDANPVGVFQQIKMYNWPASRDVAKDAAEFIKRAIQQYAAHRSDPLYANIERVQHSGNPRAYAAWQPEAQRIVAAYFGGEAGETDLKAALKAAGIGAEDNEYEFFRGVPETNGDGETIWKPEGSWACIQRLAQEVNKRAFMVSGHFYYISETELFKSKPRMILNEDTKGVNWMDFDWDIGKSFAEIDVTVQMNKWSAPPGSVIKVTSMGPLTGRWLVSNIERSLYEKEGTITLMKPTPQLPEPGGGNVDSSGTAGQFKLKDQSQQDLSMDPDAVAKRALQYALKQLGDPYQWGAEGPDKFDCSGLVQAAYQSAGYFGMPRVAQAQYELGLALLPGVPIIPGDLVFFGTRHNLHHVGMVVDRDRMVDAPHTGAVVRIENYTTWPDFYGATRPTAAK
jgi:cell wall-associated NlpC family hydrolase